MAAKGYRDHDYLFDPNYTVSSYKDHVKAMMKSQTHDIIINPVYENMFSALRHYPPSYYRFRPHKIPDSLGEDRRVHHAPAEVDGANRFKYFRRPIIPYMPTLGGQVVYARKVAAAVQPQVERPVTPPTRTVAIQTTFRESEAQTDPYSPEYILRPGTAPPELLALATLTYGMGLPAGMSELEMIERARAKRAWEATLPKVTDQDSFEKRLKMMEEMELKEWQEREDEIRRLQEARLKILTKVIAKREEENESINNERVERVWQRKLQERETMLEKIERRRFKAIRKLTEKRRRVENRIERRDIIAEYANYSSKVYAPKARDGVFQDKTSIVRINAAELESYDGILELENTLPGSVLNAKVSLPNPTEQLKNPSARRELHMQQQLALMDMRLKERKLMAKPDDKPLKYAQRIEKTPQRPPTPKVNAPRAEEEEMELAALLLQKLIRGRIAQNLMYQGKERRLQLIGELRTRHTIKTRVIEHQADNIYARGKIPVAIGGDDGGFSGSSVNNNIKGPGQRDMSGEFSVSNTYNILAGEEDFEEGLPSEPVGTENQTNAMILSSTEWIDRLFESNIQAEYVGTTLDFLSKELVRLREERRISALVKLAERTRKMREAEESDRRHSELQRRREEDQVFREIMHVHQETVDSYLEDIIAGSVDKTASIQARRQVRDYAEKINKLVDELERRDTKAPEATVADLVLSFLIPEVEKEVLRNVVKQQQRKYLIAAHRAVYSEISVIEEQSSPVC